MIMIVCFLGSRDLKKKGCSTVNFYILISPMEHNETTEYTGLVLHMNIDITQVKLLKMELNG